MPPQRNRPAGKRPAGKSDSKQSPSSGARVMRVGLVQGAMGADPEKNVKRYLALTEEAARKGAQVIVLPELFRSPYFCQTEDDAHFALAEPIPGPTSKAFAALAKKHGVVIVASLFEKRAPGLFHNTAVVLDADGSHMGRYRKMHIPDDPRFYEKYYFTPGDLGWRVFETRFGKIGVLVCWDQWYPEAARLTSLLGAELLVYPTAIGTWTGEKGLKPVQHDAWRTLQRSHAIANGVFVAAVNRIGREGELDFWGGSFLCKPSGVLAVEAGDKEEVLVADADLAEMDRHRQGWPFLRDRRIDAYDGLVERYLGDAHEHEHEHEHGDDHGGCCGG
jgi:N-carbamoylputrescine amidase